MSYDTSTYVEGVPVKISEKYRPPRKVSKKASCNYQVNTEVLTTEYDLTLENETLKWLANLKQYKENRKGIRAEKLRKYYEEKQRKLEEEERKREEEQRIKEEEEEKLKNEKLKKINETEMADLNEEVEVEEINEIENSEDFESNNINCEHNKDENNDQRESASVHNNDELSNIHTSDEDGEKLKTEVPNPENSIILDPTLNHQANSTANPNLAYSNNFSYQSPLGSEQFAQYSYSNVLIPTQIAAESKDRKSPIKSNNDINFADFENDASDPFDSAALKSINEMEELAKVLQVQNMNKVPNDKVTYNPNLPYQQNHQEYNRNFGATNSYQYNNYQSTFSNNQPIFNHVPVNPQAVSPPSAVPSSTNYKNSTSQYPYNFQPHWNHIPASHTQPTVDIPVPPVQPYSFPHQMTSANSSYNSAVIPSSINSSNNFGISTVESINKREDLEQFYSRYYSNKKSSHCSGARSGESTPVTNMAMKTLSSSNSVPDLTAVEDAEVQNIVSGKQMEISGQLTSTSRPSSTAGIQVTYRNSSKPTGSFRSRSRCRLSDPFAELTEEAQNLVQSMAEMGFPRPRVARAVQKLGTDHKKLLEVLLTLQSFEEKGESDYLSESAFYYYMGDLRQVHEFLEATKELLKLGFEEEQVAKLLFKHRNNKDKCLEELIA